MALSMLEDIKQQKVDQYVIERDDLDLIKVIETLQKDANDDLADLKVVEIPSDIEWKICDYDGIEWVAEKHRTWG
jgi:hypothetical protein